MGRKPKPIKLKRDQRLTIMLTQDELAALEQLAKDCDSVSSYIREKIFAGSD